jgi:hypothetical protein
VYLIPFVHQRIHQLVPVIGGFYHDPYDFFLVRAQRLQDQLRLICHPLLEDPLPLLINDPNEITVAMKITPRV